MKKVKLLSVLNFVFYVVAFLVSMLSQFNFFNNQNNAQISAKYQTIFTPAGITFSIWGLIYTLLFVFVIYHLIQSNKKSMDDEANQAVEKIGYLFVLNNLATTLWVFAFSFEQIGVSLLLMVVQLLTLTLIIIKLNIYRPHTSMASRLFTQIPLTIYFAWICVATLANASVYFVSINWNGGFSENKWAIILIWLAVALSAFMDIKKKNPYFGLVIIWALYGIYLKLHPLEYDLYREVILTTWVALAIVGLTVLIRFIINFMNKSFT